MQLFFKSEIQSGCSFYILGCYINNFANSQAEELEGAAEYKWNTQAAQTLTASKGSGSVITASSSDRNMLVSVRTFRQETGV